GIVDEHVDVAEALDRLRRQRLDRGFLADVGDHARHRIDAVPGRDLLRELAAVGDIGDHDARALGGEGERIVPADALGAAGHDRGAAGESGHEGYPFGATRAMKVAKAASCCLMKPRVASSLSSPVFSSNLAAQLPMKISGLLSVKASRNIIDLRRS